MPIRFAGLTVALALCVSAAAPTDTSASPLQHRTRVRRTTPARKAATRSSTAAPAPRWTSPRGTEALSASLASALDGRTRNGSWGVMIVSISRGDTLFERNPDALLKPASTMKMYSASLALDQFGPDHIFKTVVLRDGRQGADGVVQGNVYLRGDGDPALGSPRFWHGDQPMDLLARQIAARGIKRIHGDVVADATAFDDSLIPSGWKTSYLGAAYAARVSALTLNENLVWVVVEPGPGGAKLSLEPATTTFPIVGSVRQTGGSGGYIRAAIGNDGAIHVSGSIGRSSPTRKWSLVVPEPALFAGGALKAALQKAGVAVDGTVRLGRTPDGATTLGSVGSPPLWQIVTEMNRESINLFAELLFRDAARANAQNHVGNVTNGLAHLRQFLQTKVGASPQAVDVSDGSGLSELDRVTPRSMIDLLSFAHHASWGPVFHASLPLEGESGTLARRARYTPAHGNLHAKTGTTNVVNSLGGYVTARNGEIIAFSFLYNGTDHGNAKAAMDAMGATLAEFVRE